MRTDAEPVDNERTRAATAVQTVPPHPLGDFPADDACALALRPLFQVAPALGLLVVSHFVISAIIVGLATYVIMPRYTRWIAGGLYR